MPEPTFQTVQLGRGRHRSPSDGACVMELSSMIAGERFSDRPRSVCPVIGAFLRAYNDLLREHDHDELYPYAAMVVGSRSTRRVARRRARLLQEWATPGRRGRFVSRLGRLETWSWTGVVAAEVAVRYEPGRRRREVSALLESLLAVGTEGTTPAWPVAVPGAPEGEREAQRHRTPA